MDGASSSCSLPSPPPLPASMASRARRRRLRPLARAAARGSLLAGFVAAAEAGRPHLLLPVCQLGLSLGGLQFAWLCFRVRARLLLALQTAGVASGDQEEPPPRRGVAVAPTSPGTPPRASAGHQGSSYKFALQSAVTPAGFAVKRLADKTPVTRGRDVSVAVAAALLAATALVALVVTCLPLLVTVPKYHTAWWLVVISGGVGAFSGVLSACLAPTGADAALLLVLQGCFTYSRMNMVVAHHQNSLHSDPEVIDDLYLTLTGCCVMITWRVVSSTDVLHTLLATLLDTLAFVYLLATMMELTDFVDDPNADEHPFFFSTFFLAVSAGQVARWALGALSPDGSAPSSSSSPSPSPSPSPWRSRASCRRAGEHCAPVGRALGAALVAAAAAAAVAAISFACVPRQHSTSPGLLAVFPLAAVVAQLGGAVLGMLNETALVPRRARLSVWHNGALDVINPFLLAWVVVHPFSKHLLAEAAAYKGSSSLP